VVQALDTFEISFRYKVAINSLSLATASLLENYPLDKNRGNYVIYPQLSKTKLKEIRSLSRAAIRFLVELPTKTVPTKKTFKKWANKFDKCQKYLASCHLDSIYSAKFSDQLLWDYAGTALHYLLDSFYHLFIKFSCENTIPIKCRWCKTLISPSWKKELSHIFTFQIPLCLLYASLAQHQVCHPNQEITSNDIKDSFDDITLLFHTVLKSTDI